jgi:ubiquinone/menaquinone biosynthesis C-methylase UbiE
MSAEPDPATAWASRQAAQARAFDEIGARYDEAFPHKEGQIEAVGRLIERLPAGAQVLDIGCGTGVPTARQLADAGLRVTGIDISPGMLALARVNVPEAEFLQADAVDFAGTGFDAAVAFFSLLMLSRADIDRALAAIHEGLKPGGHFVLSMVEADLDDTTLSFLGNPIRVTGYLRDELTAVVAAAGFEVLDLRSLSYAPASTEAYPEIQLFLHARRTEG